MSTSSTREDRASVLNTTFRDRDDPAPPRRRPDDPSRSRYHRVLGGGRVALVTDPEGDERSSITDVEGRPAEGDVPGDRGSFGARLAA